MSTVHLSWHANAIILLQCQEWVLLRASSVEHLNLQLLQSYFHLLSAKAHSKTQSSFCRDMQFHLIRNTFSRESFLPLDYSLETNVSCFSPPLFCFIPVFYPLSCPPLIAGQVWEIIGRLSGVFNGAALMESFSRTSPDFITSVRQLRLIYKAV